MTNPNAQRAVSVLQIVGNMIPALAAHKDEATLAEFAGDYLGNLLPPADVGLAAPLVGCVVNLLKGSPS